MLVSCTLRTRMHKRLADRAWLEQTLRELYPSEDIYHILFRDSEFRALHMILTERKSEEQEALKELSSAAQKRRKQNQSLTARYEACAKLDRFLRDLALFAESLKS